MERLLDAAVEWCGKRYEKYSGKNDSAWKACYTMTIGGAIVLWYDWMQSGFAAPGEKLAGEISDYIVKNVAAIWNRT